MYSVCIHGNANKYFYTKWEGYWEKGRVNKEWTICTYLCEELKLVNTNFNFKCSKELYLHQNDIYSHVIEPAL